jgi:Uma2 family endonuclease
MLALQPQIITLEEYEALPEDKRVEVFDDVVYDMASPSQEHQTILTELLVTIKNYMKKKKGKCQVFPVPFDVKLNNKPLVMVQPDIMIVCDKDKLDGKRCNGAPDFIIEIVSPSNASDDYIKKAYYYQTYGVREYWIVDPRKKLVSVNYFEGDSFGNQYTFMDSVKVNIYEDLIINFNDLDI